MRTAKKISLIVLILSYIIAGINHFRSPGGYIKIIPAYLPYPQILNLLAGFFEISFGVMLIFAKTRRLAAWGIILMLIAFLPVHIDMIIHAPLKVDDMVVTKTIAWLRIPLQGLLILWAWWHTKKDRLLTKQ